MSATAPTSSAASRQQREDVTKKVHEAASSRQRAGELRRLLEENVQNAHLLDPVRGRAPIHTAIANNQEECLEILLQNGGKSKSKLTDVRPC